MDEYKKIMSKMDNIIENLCEIGELAELTSFFPVIEFVNLRDEFDDFYHALRGASKKEADFNYKMAKMNLSSIYGRMVFEYADTDSCRVNSDDNDDDEDNGKNPTQYAYDECFRKRVCERLAGEHCKKCPYAWKCFKFNN